MIRSLLLGLLLVAGSAQAITADAYIVTDMAGNVLLEKNADKQKSIASITKLVTVRAAKALDPNALITIQKSDIHAGKMGSTPLQAGQSYPRKDLIALALISSDNVAALALGRTTPQTPLTLPKGVSVVEASGLNPKNVGTARGIAELARELAPTDLAPVSVLPTWSVTGKLRRTTNRLLGLPGWDFKLAKTGYIRQSGGCVVAVFETSKGLVTAVILGAQTVPQRWRDLYELRKMVEPSAQFAGPRWKEPVKKKSVKKKQIKRKKNGPVQRKAAVRARRS